MAVKRKKKGLRWMSVLAVITIFLCIAGIAWLGRGPWLAWVSQRERAESLRSELSKLQRENEGLLERNRSISTPSGMEGEARRQGWVKPGEQIIRMPEDAAPVPDR